LWVSAVSPVIHEGLHYFVIASLQVAVGAASVVLNPGVDEETWVPSVITRACQPVIMVLKDSIIRQTVPSNMLQQPSASKDVLSEWLEPVDWAADNSRKRWLLAEYVLPNMKAVAMHGKLSDSLKPSKKGNIRHLCIGTLDVPNALHEVPVVALVRKLDARKLLQNELMVGGVAPISVHAVIFRGNVQNDILKFFGKFSQVLRCFASSMEVEKMIDRDYTMDHLIKYTQGMSHDVLKKFIADCVLIPKKKRDKLQTAIITSRHALFEHRASLRHVVRNAIDMSNASTHVQPRSAFKQATFDLPMQVLDTSLLRAGHGSLTLQDYIDNPGIHQSISLLLLGPTRCGKTELSKHIGLYLSMTYKDQQAVVIFSNTIDVLKKYQDDLLPGAWVLLDDTEPWSDQLVHSSAAGWKSLLQCKDMSSCRARNVDVEISERVGKIITSNCKDFAEWLGGTARGEHAKAINMRLAVVVVPDGFSLWAQAAPAVASTGMLPQVLAGAARESAFMQAIGQSD